MGRSAGWIALTSGVAARAHVNVVPEIPFELEANAEVVRNRKAKGRRSTIIVAGERAKP